MGDRIPPRIHEQMAMTKEQLLVRLTKKQKARLFEEALKYYRKTGKTISMAELVRKAIDTVYELQ